MPYKVMGKNLMHLKNGQWRVKQRCKSKEAAEAAMRLMQAKEHNPGMMKEQAPKMMRGEMMRGK